MPLGVVLLSLAWVPARGVEGLFSTGIRLQGSVDFEPGNDFLLGPELGYSNFYLARHRLQLKFSYLTSRLEQVFRENILRQDYFLFTPMWHFRRDRLFDPILQLDMGYTRYDVEFDEFKGFLDNDAWIAALQVGLNINLAEGEFGAYYHFGYNFFIPKSSGVLPGVFAVGVWKHL